MFNRQLETNGALKKVFIEIADVQLTGHQGNDFIYVFKTIFNGFSYLQ